MKTIKIKVTITQTAANISFKSWVYRSKYLEDPYDKSKYNKKSFEWELDDLVANREYSVLFTFDTPGKVSVEITGDIVEGTISDSFEAGAYTPSYLITTKN
jgi:hypothetical protein